MSPAKRTPKEPASAASDEASAQSDALAALPVKKPSSAAKSEIANPTAPKHTKTFGNYVVHCSTGEPNGLPLRIFCEKCETAAQARAATTKLLNAQRPAHEPRWKIERVEFLGLDAGRNYP
jgi:hypothetical protein